jgi:Cu/Ag efflux pump CusA
MSREPRRLVRAKQRLLTVVPVTLAIIVLLLYLNFRNLTEVTIILGTLLRVRQIIMTGATIIAGLLPIMLGGGTGAEVMRRIATPIVGGMVRATLLTLVVIPAVFLLWKQRVLVSHQGPPAARVDAA